jgi:tetratricopeptide (TPR) repeat protein
MVGRILPLTRSRAGGAPRRPWLVGALLLALAGVVFGGLARPAAAQAVKGEVSATVDNGFARLVFHFTEEVESQVRFANNILTISFARPVDIVVDRINASVAGYVSASRRDPDGKAIRIALARKVTMNSMAAGERLFVDLLPDTWTGLPPGLPRDVIEELARRARDAEKKLRAQRGAARQEQMAPSRVRVVSQPNFTRYVFDLPELVGVSADNGKDKLTLTFDAMLKFDLADAKATLPAVIESIDSELEQNAVLVRFNFSGKVDLRTFREDNSYVVDVTSTEAKASRRDSVRSDELGALAGDVNKRSAPPPAAEPPPTMPARGLPPPERRAPAPPMPPAPAPVQRETAPPAAPAPPPVAQTKPAETKPVPAPTARPNPPPVSEPHANAAAPANDGQINAVLQRQGETLALVFPFTAPTPAAVFRRADMLWLVFDTVEPIALKALEADATGTIRGVSVTQLADATVVRLKLERPRLISLTAEGPVWTVTLASEMVEPTRPIGITRNIVAPARSSITIPFDDARALHRLADPEAGDKLLVATALGPARGLLKTQDFVEFRALASTHGVVLQPFADDLGAELAADKLVLTRPAGLSLSAVTGSGAGAPMHLRQVFDTQSWGFDRQANFAERKSELIEAAAAANDGKRLAARSDLARFYLARDMAVEAKAVLDVALAANPPNAEDSTPLVLHAVACIMSGRPEQALKDLAQPTVGNQHDAPLWRSLAFARLSKWTDAIEGFRNVEAALGALPLEMQRVLMKEMIRAFVEVGDITGAVNQMHEFEAIGIPRELEPAMSVLAGRVAEGLGRPQDALRAYAASADSPDRPSAAQAQLREIVLRQSLGGLDRTDSIVKLETLTAVWRGDETEIEALQLLTRLYTEEGLYRSAFHVVRTALKAHPSSEMTRRIQDEAIATFDSLFLAGKGDVLPAIDALALFYDFRELTPIGRRGDEMIRRLADRLVSVDLLDQAAELLQHQVDNRLQGAARAQVATRLAVIYLMNRKADRALATLRTTRVSDLSNEMRNQRLLIEARALSDTGRHDLAIEVIANIAGREAMRLRSDILWAGKHWSAAAEQIELIYGDRWKEFDVLTDTERADILRAASGYALGEDTIGLMRFREKYAARFGDGPDRRAFEVVTAPIVTSAAEFREIAHAVASVDTLDAFLRDLRARYPETGALPAAPRPPAPPAAAAATPPKGDPPATGTPRPPTARTAEAR